MELWKRLPVKRWIGEGDALAIDTSLSVDPVSFVEIFDRTFQPLHSPTSFLTLQTSTDNAGKMQGQEVGPLNSP